MKKALISLSVLVLASTIAALSGQTSNYRWQKDQKSVALVKSEPGKQEFTLWKLNIDPALKPFFHPLCAPDGTLLSAEAPPDHLWHLGQWFCWKYINKLNYWEYTGDATKAVSEGRTALESAKIRTSRDGKATITMKIVYHPWSEPEKPVMTEKRVITVTAPEPDGSYRIDYEMTFVPLTDVLLDRTPSQTSPGGVSWGGYAGLSMRFDQRLSDPVYFSEKRDSVINGEGNAFVAANLKAPDGHLVQMVILDNPGNPRYPSPWYTINRPKEKFWFYSPALLYNDSMQLKAGQTLHLKYRILVPARPLKRGEIGWRN